MELSESEKLLLEIAVDSGEYETEYDGRMYTFCRYCEVNIENEEHDEDCAIIRAQRALGKVWQEYLDQQQQEIEKQRELEKLRVQQQQEREAENARRKEKVECDKCGAKVSCSGLEQHQASQRCERKQRGEPKVKGRSCKCCKRSISHMHMNAKFCSNAGSGNCKDRYNNRSTPKRRRRMSMFKEPAINNDYDCHGEYFDIIEDDPSWDAHKGTF